MYGMGVRPTSEVKVFLDTREIMSAVRKGGLGSNRMANMILRGRCFYIILLNVDSPTEDKNDDVNHSLYEELVTNSINTISIYNAILSAIRSNALSKR
jgi:hypothetical protein